MSAILWAVRSIPFVSVLICVGFFDAVSAMVMLLACLGTTIGWRVRAAPRFEIALNIVLLIAAWSSVWELYDRWSWWDIVVHFALTAMLAVLSTWSLEHWVLKRRFARTRRAFTIVVSGIVLSLVWEVMEQLGYIFVDRGIEVAPGDTIGDVIAGVAGAALAAFWSWRTPHEREGRR